jgi:Mycothiol maleylpyruvate isomerase N-terminal domain
MSVTATQITDATAEMRRVLGATADGNWSARAGDLDWSCWETGAHIADDLFSYASQVIAQPAGGYLPIEARIEAGATPSELLESIVMCGGLLALAVSSASPDARAYHPYGTSDPEGFAAMGVVEVLVHAHDIARGLNLAWVPPNDLCSRVLDRLFPDAPTGSPAEVLLWCTGRAALGSLPRETMWRWDSSVRGVC